MRLLSTLGGAVRALLADPADKANWSAIAGSAASILNDPVQVAARTAWAEARGSGAEGMQAVLASIGNRVREPGWWGTSFITVCLSRNQFSCWHASDPNFPKLMTVTATDPQFRVALGLAQLLVAGRLGDITHGADSYYALGTARPAWATLARFRCVLGGQAFYRVGVNGYGCRPGWVEGTIEGVDAPKES